MKKIFGLLIGGATALTLASCKDDTVGIDDLEELEFRITWPEDGGRFDAISKVVDEYNKNNGDDLDVKVVGGNEDTTAITTSKAHIKQMPYRYVKSLGGQGLFVDLTDDFTEEKSYFHENIVNLGIEEGSMYGIPWIGHSMSILYNKDVLSQLPEYDTQEEIDAIDTWDKFAAMVAAADGIEGKDGISIAGKQHNDVSWMANQFVYSFGGSVMNEDLTASNLGDVNSKRGLDYYFNTLGQYAPDGWAGHDGNDVMNEFKTQRAVFEIQGPWGVTDIWKQAEADRFEVGVIPFSQIQDPTTGTYGHAEIGPYFLTASEGLSDEVYEQVQSFMKYMISKDAQDMIMDGEYDESTNKYYPFRVPMRIDMKDSEFFTQHPQLLSFIEGFENPSIDVPTSEWSQIREQYVLANYSGIASGTKTVEEAVEAINEGSTRLLA